MAALESLKYGPNDALKQDETSGSFSYSGKPTGLHPWLWQLDTDMLHVRMLAEADAEVERRKTQSRVSRENTPSLLQETLRQTSKDP
eukprot:2192101-Karenia_brevis.AAC.1